MNLLNEAREKTEEIIDVLHQQYKGERKKVRTYRQRARKDFLKVAKNRRPGVKNIRKGNRKQLQYIARNVRHIEKLAGNSNFNGKSPLSMLSNRQYRNLLVAHELYRQQQKMYKERVHKIPERIVSISQPHIRPIVRGKANADVEFGAKISMSMVDGYAFLEKLSWNSFNEAGELEKHIENYKCRFGCYPKSVHADAIYRNRENRRFCKNKGIALSGPPLGRPPKDPAEYRKLLKGAKKAEIDRIPIEGKFGNGKRRYGWSRITTKLKNTSETTIAMTVLVMNLEKLAGELLLSLFSTIRDIGFILRRAAIFA